MKFRINFGKHFARDDTGEMRKYVAGDIIESAVDLTATTPILDVANGIYKFVRVEDDVVPAPPDFKHHKG